MKKSYIVTFKKDGISKSEAANLLKISESNLKELHDVINTPVNPETDFPIHLNNLEITLLYLNEVDVAEIRQIEGIASVYEDYELTNLGIIEDVYNASEDDAVSNQPQPNITRVGAPIAWNLGYTGQDINVAILDTGIAPHPDLVLTGGVSFVNGAWNEDLSGHGTHCAGIAAGRLGINGVYGVAKDCNLFSVRIATGKLASSISITLGLEWCIAQGIQVASVSWGALLDPEPFAAEMIYKCQSKGTIVVISAGNSFNDKDNPLFPYVNTWANAYAVGSPLSSPLAIGAVDGNNNITNFSSRGTKNSNWNPVSVVAPGYKIYSTYLNNGYASMTGTSMSAPHVSGLVALMLQQNKNIKSEQVLQFVKSGAILLGNYPQPNETYGNGLINCIGSIFSDNVIILPDFPESQGNSYVGWRLARYSEFSSEILFFFQPYSKYNQIPIWAVNFPNVSNSIEFLSLINTLDAQNFIAWLTHSYNGNNCCVFAIKSRNTGTGNVEVHIMTTYNAQPNWVLHTGIPITQADGAENITSWDAGYYNGDYDALFAFKTKNTATQTVEIHILASPNYQNFHLHTGSAIPLSDAPNYATFQVGQYNNDQSCVFAIKTKNTDSGFVEIHILSSSNTYSTFSGKIILYSISDSDALNYSNWFIGSYSYLNAASCLFGVKTSNTATGNIELHSFPLFPKSW